MNVCMIMNNCHNFYVIDAKFLHVVCLYPRIYLRFRNDFSGNSGSFLMRVISLEKTEDFAGFFRIEPNIYLLAKDTRAMHGGR